MGLAELAQIDAEISSIEKTPVSDRGATSRETQKSISRWAEEPISKEQA